VVRGQQVFNAIPAGQNPKANQALYILYDWVIGSPNQLQDPRYSLCKTRIKKLTDQNGQLISPEPGWGDPLGTNGTAVTQAIQQTAQPPKTCQYSFTPTSPGQYKIKFTIGDSGDFVYRTVQPGPNNYPPGERWWCRKTEVEYTITVDP
jgi:hypothetical protein